MSPRKAMKPRSIRAGKEWEDALAAADERGENLSEKIREFIKTYGRRERGNALRSADACTAVLRLDDRDRVVQCSESAGHDKPQSVQWFVSGPTELDYIARPTPHRVTLEWWSDDEEGKK